MTTLLEFIFAAFDAGAALKDDPIAVAVQQSSDVLLLGLAATLATVVSSLIGGVVAVLVARLNTKANIAAAQIAKAAVAVQEVKTDLKKNSGITNSKLDQLESVAGALQNVIEEMSKVGRDTHTLVNSNFGVQLKMYADVCWQLYEVVKTPDAKIRAEEATRIYEEHVAKQAVVDAAKGAS